MQILQMRELFSFLLLDLIPNARGRYFAIARPKFHVQSAQYTTGAVSLSQSREVLLCFVNKSVFNRPTTPTTLYLKTKFQDEVPPVKLLVERVVPNTSAPQLLATGRSRELPATERLALIETTSMTNRLFSHPTFPRDSDPW
ncbi:hypothetical protein T439DRAFT_2896 [Meredithblackwellia eburnea MCA 4105]